MVHKAFDEARNQRFTLDVELTARDDVGIKIRMGKTLEFGPYDIYGHLIDKESATWWQQNNLPRAEASGKLVEVRVKKRR